MKPASIGGGFPCLFEWAYGGRSVYLSGSFTRWTDHVAMIPVEGFPSVFRIVCSLTPGYHEYKFCVDGEWQHDQNKPCARGNFGIVNTIILGGEPGCRQDIPNPLISSASGMDLDNDGALQRMIRVSDGMCQSALSAFPHNDIEVSRHHVSEYMSVRTIYDWMIPDSGKVTALDIGVSVKGAFQSLYDEGSAHAILLDSYNQKFVGVLSPSDFILILRELGSRRSIILEEELKIHTVSAWKAGKSHLDRQIGLRRVASRGLIQAGPDDNLKDLALHILKNEVSTVPIIDPSSKDVSLPKLLYFASLSEILKCICQHFQNCLPLLPIFQLPVCTLNMGTWVAAGEKTKHPIAISRPSDRLLTVWDLLLQARVSSTPIVDDNGSLLGIYSRSDIMALAKDRAYAHINFDKFTVSQALQFFNDVYSTQESSRCHVCLRTDPAFKVMELLAKPGVRRVVIVEQSSRRVEGIISLRDVFKFLLG